MVGMAGLTRVAFRTGRSPQSLILGAVFGLLAGLGEGIWMRQVGIFPAGEASWLVVPLIGLGLGLLAGAVVLRRPGAPHPPTVEVPGYELLTVLGRGRGTDVYLARQLALDRLVALKRLAPGTVPQQASLASRLDHPHLARVYASFEHAGNHYLVTEYVDG